MTESPPSASAAPEATSTSPFLEAIRNLSDLRFAHVVSEPSPLIVSLRWTLEKRINRLRDLAHRISLHITT